MAVETEPIPTRYKAPIDAFFVKFNHADWIAEIGPTTLNGSTWTVDPVGGLTTASASIDGSTTLVKISGGTLNTQVLLTNVFTTANLQTKQRSIRIVVRVE